MKKSICIVCSMCLPHIGGVEQYVDNFSKELIRRGHKVTLLTSEMKGVPKYESQGNLEIYRLPSIPLMGGRFPVLKQGRELWDFTKEFKKKKFDVMLVNMRFYFISLYAVRLAKKMNVRCIMLDHGTSHLNTGAALTSKLGEWFEHGITWLEKRYCKEFAGVSGATLEWVKHFHVNSDNIFYNAIDVELFERTKGKSHRNFRKEFGIPEEDVVISFVGRITIEKGIRELVHAMKDITAHRKNVWLLAAGKGYLLEELKQEKVPNVHLLGQMPMVDIVELLQESDIFCLPSVSEGFPTCVLEASVCDNFVITTFRGGAKELITNEEFGLILPDNNEKGLSKAIVNVLDKPDYRISAAQKCKERVVEKYTWKQTVETFLKLL